MKGLARLRLWLGGNPARMAAVIVGVVLGAVGFLPLFGGPGYEHSLASGIVVPSAAAIATALELRTQRDGRSPLDGVARGIGVGALLAGVALSTALVHGVRVGFCDALGGILFFGLTAGFGSVLGGVWGAIVGEWANGRSFSRRKVIACALALPVGGVVVSVGRFLTSPMIFAFDPFVGYFSGTLYDTVIDAGPAIFSYRAGTLSTLAATGLFASLLGRDAASRLTIARGSAFGLRMGAAVAFGLLSLGITTMGPSLGHWQTAATIASELGKTVSGPRCTVHLAKTSSPEDAEWALRDCEQQLRAVEAALGIRGPDRVTYFLFADAAQKKRLMGAADTYVAKPWREEVYLQASSYPHPVLGHELAHVVAGRFGRGPFRIAGELGGLWPNPGLIEGMAVAASPHEGELTEAEWSRAMLDLGILPTLRSVFSMEFLGGNAARSYTVAGAFVRFVIDTYGVEVARRWYGGGSIEALSGHTWAELERGFSESLAKYTLSPEAAAVARARFDRPGVFGRTCPHLVDALRQDADRCRDSNQLRRAVELYSVVLDEDPHDHAARISRAATLARSSDAAARAEGRRALEAVIADRETPRTAVYRAEEVLADDELLHGEAERAASRYERLLPQLVDDDHARQVEVKKMAATDVRAGEAIVPFLLGGLDSAGAVRGPDVMVGAMSLGAYAASGAALADYLAGRNARERGWIAWAAVRLDRALDSPAGLSPRLVRAAIKQRAIVACLQRDEPKRATLLEAVRAPTGPFSGFRGRRAEVERLLARCFDAPAGAALSDSESK